jgi:hypothetical protein
VYYGVIFTVDAEKKHIDDDEYKPAPEKDDDGDPIWNQTEDEESEYDLFDEYEAPHKVKRGWHRKWCSCLTQEQMDKFVEKMCFDTICDTMGALGMPQPDGDICLGMILAYALDNSNVDGVVQAYVTPYLMQDDADENLIPELELTSRTGEKELTENDCKIIRGWIAARYSLRG